MDCCNYVEAYSAGGHFYQQQQQQQQQQQYFCYDNGNAAYAGYDAAPISNAIEINARYNGAIPATYPTDYVYNPKEARLRKAMREQSREQSRERSRRSILQSAIAIANARTAAIGGPPAAVTASLAGGFLNQHHRTFDCVPAASVPIGPPHRAAEAWFAAHRPKPVHSPRIGDWYVDGDPIERLQAMGTMHQQRGLDKTSIKEQRSQECATAFSPNGHTPTDFAVTEREIRRQESAAEYADFVDGQKWHPYQNSASPHPHPRTPHPSPQMAGILQPNVQNAHGHTHGPWGQFCHDVSAMTRNAAIRGPRHAVFLRDRPASRHCAFTEDASRMGYAPSKLDVESIRASYPPAEHQMPRLLESAVDTVIDSTTAMNRREEDAGTRWEPGTVTTEMSLDELVPTSMPQEGALAREKERQSWQTSERFEPKKKPVAKQPLPGFHQAFGSTEIGRFSRSEFFVNMVGENGGGGGGSGGASGGDIGEADSGDVSRERLPLLDTAGNAATAAEPTAATASASSTTAATATATANAGRTFDPEDQATFAVGDGVVGASYCRQPATMPRWHSPHVGAIGSEI
ncbi:PREDICTED: uncharacterized protein LOC106747588 isoform X2 [Dinoponera quadriceps]|uniref:Uncharacterized protein LOC106747588 isoform X2 n=1 Tax=Dinoponera quadriceps TaxID=609295 RepID=A0A6P3XR79_DINQU|nr:PREDICTED: uncharacterized protein LOC106747588 isoform X2 [Dinoponera quadriceps]